MSAYRLLGDTPPASGNPAPQSPLLSPRAEEPMRAGGAISEIDQTSADREGEEILSFARELADRAENWRGAFEGLIAVTKAAFAAAHSERAWEMACEDAAHDLRLMWLEASAASTARSYRSPTAAEAARTATGRRVEFGYERDLKPDYLERRCAQFFGPTPAGWTADHILLSSGQSAMAAMLHALDGSDEQISAAHLGAYFETSEILSLFKSMLHLKVKGRKAAKMMEWADADLTVIEPVFCDGEFGVVDVPGLIAQHDREPYRPRAYVFDTTLSGTAFAVEPLLPKLRGRAPRVAFRLLSGLKLFQGGLELANVGILSVFSPEGSGETAAQWGERIRRIRTLFGFGLPFAGIAALEAPWFLNRPYTDRYQSAVFDNNAALAKAVAQNNNLFRGVYHPSLLNGAGVHMAPYCAFRLAEGDGASYILLEEYIAREAAARGILFAKGGSFGFRGHRFEVVRPDDGTEPFLRVAMGRRIGGSLFDVLQLMSDVARAPNVASL
jgi:hypothetical protein